MKKISLILVLSISLLGGGCSNAIDYSIYPEQFGSILMDYDTQYDKPLESYETEDIYRCYELDDGSFYFITKTWGYEEDMLLGVKLSEEKVLAVDILFENESDKYGEYVTEDWFLDRFVMELPEEIECVKKQKDTDNQVVAITGATVTSQAVVDGVNGCIMRMEDSQ